VDGGATTYDRTCRPSPICSSGPRHPRAEPTGTWRRGATLDAGGADRVRVARSPRRRSILTTAGVVRVTRDPTQCVGSLRAGTPTDIASTTSSSLLRRSWPSWSRRARDVAMTRRRMRVLALGDAPRTSELALGGPRAARGAGAPLFGVASMATLTALPRGGVGADRLAGLRARRDCAWGVLAEDPLGVRALGSRSSRRSRARAGSRCTAMDLACATPAPSLARQFGLVMPVAPLVVEKPGRRRALRARPRLPRGSRRCCSMGLEGRERVLGASAREGRAQDRVRRSSPASASRNRAQRSRRVMVPFVSLELTRRVSWRSRGSVGSRDPRLRRGRTAYESPVHLVPFCCSTRRLYLGWRLYASSSRAASIRLGLPVGAIFLDDARREARAAWTIRLACHRRMARRVGDRAAGSAVSDAHFAYTTGGRDALG